MSIIRSQLKLPPSVHGGGALWRGNEPAGFTQVVDTNFSTDPPTGWFPSGTQGIISDPTAPKSPPDVWQYFFNGPPNAFTGGFSPGSLDSNSGLNNFGAREMYFCTYIKHSANWYGHPSHNNKIFHGWYAGANRIVLEALGTDVQPLFLGFDLQGITAGGNQGGGTLGEYASTVEYTRGVWHLVECHFKGSTTGSLDATMDLWMDGALVVSVTGIELTPTQDTFDMLQISAIWGGTGSAVPADQFLWIDHMYLSKK